MCSQTSNLAAQSTTVTRVIHSHSVPMKAEVRTRDTTGETNGRYLCIPAVATNNHNVAGPLVAYLHVLYSKLCKISLTGLSWEECDHPS